MTSMSLLIRKCRARFSKRWARGPARLLRGRSIWLIRPKAENAWSFMGHHALRGRCVAIVAMSPTDPARIARRPRRRPSACEGCCGRRSERANSLCSVSGRGVAGHVAEAVFSPEAACLIRVRERSSGGVAALAGTQLGDPMSLPDAHWRLDARDPQVWDVAQAERSGGSLAHRDDDQTGHGKASCC